MSELTTMDITRSKGCYEALARHAVSVPWHDGVFRALSGNVAGRYRFEMGLGSQLRTYNPRIKPAHP